MDSTRPDLADQSWDTTRPRYTKENKSQAFATGGPDDPAIQLAPAGGVNLQTEDSLALQGLGENRIDGPLRERPGSWHNADHAFNETQFKHGHLPSEVTPQDPTKTVTKVNTLEDGLVYDAYIKDIAPDDPAHVSKVMASIAEKAYSTSGKEDVFFHHDKSGIPFSYNPFGGVRQRIVANALASSSNITTKDGITPLKDAPGSNPNQTIGSERDRDESDANKDAFLKAAEADRMEYFYQQAAPPPMTEDEAREAKFNDSTGLRRISIRENQSTLMERVSQRQSALAATQPWRTGDGFGSDMSGAKGWPSSKTGGEWSIGTRPGAKDKALRDMDIDRIRSVPGADYMAVQPGVGELSSRSRRDYLRSKKTERFGEGAPVGV